MRVDRAIRNVAGIQGVVVRFLQLGVDALTFGGDRRRRCAAIRRRIHQYSIRNVSDEQVVVVVEFKTGRRR